jgi:hypothetical protein
MQFCNFHIQHNQYKNNKYGFKIINNKHIAFLYLFYNGIV